MSEDRFTEVVTTGYGGRIINSLKGVLVGVVCFAGSFLLLYWNDGRVDLSNVAKTATEISAATANTNGSFVGKLVSASGKVNSNQIIGDGLFLNPDRFVAVERKVEMFGWVEKSSSHSVKNIGGSETTQTTYTYSKEWTENPESSSDFKHPEGHENPKKSLDNHTRKVGVATIGAYNFDPQSITLPDFSQLSLSSHDVAPGSVAILADDKYLFVKKSEVGTLNNPQIGDLRISYHILRSGFEGTIFGKLSESRIDPYLYKAGDSFYRLFSGTREQAISMLHKEYATSIWILRLTGFLLMWFGLMILFEPIGVLLDFLPFLGSLSRLLIGVVTFGVSLALSILTIIVSMLAHNPVVLGVVSIIAIGVVFSFFAMLKNRKKTVVDENNS